MIIHGVSMFSCNGRKIDMVGARAGLLPVLSVAGR
jgi:hypothetical protein